MKVTTDYMIGSTAIQIVEKGNKIKVIDVDRHRKTRTTFRNVILVISLSFLLIGICYSVINQTNESVILNQQIASLNTEILQLQKENDDLMNLQEKTIDYDQLLMDAKTRFGMVFPKNNQVYTYESSKSTAVRSRD